MENGRTLKNILLLSLCWAFGIGAAFVQIGTTSLVTEIFVGTSYSTVPVGSIFIVSFVAAAFVPSHERRYGAKCVYLVATFLAMIGVVIEIFALELHQSGQVDGWGAFSLLLVGSMLQGYCYAATTRLRLMVSGFSTKEFLPKAVAIVIGGGVLGAFIGPQLVNYTKDMTSTLYVGTYIQIVIMYALYFITVCFIDFAKPKRAEKSSKATSGEQHDIQEELEAEETSRPRSLWELLQSTEYVIVVLNQTVIYASMAVFMLATPLAMSQYNLVSQVPIAIMLHQLGMFVPSFFSGKLVQLTGTYQAQLLGFIILLLGAGIYLINNTAAAFMVGITLIGLGWNFTFVGASARLVTLYSSEEKPIAEAFNDATILGVLGILAVFTGSIYEALSWDVFVIVFMAITSLALAPVLYMISKTSSQTKKTMKTSNESTSSNQDPGQVELAQV